MINFTDIRKRVKPTSKIYFSSLLQINYPKIKADQYNQTEELLRRTFAGNADIVQRSFFVGGREEMEALLIFQSGSVNKSLLYNDVMKPLMSMKRIVNKGEYNKEYLTKYITKTCIYAAEIEIESDIDLAANQVYDGKVLLVIKGLANYFILNLSDVPKRPVQESDLEKRTRGTRAGFVENLEDNIALMRGEIRDPNLMVEAMKLGRRSRTDVALIYIKDLVDNQILQELKRRLKNIETDSILATGYIESFIEDNPWSPFPFAHGTERPDKAAANILEGRILIIANGTPFTLIVPALFIQFFQATEDYYEKPHVGLYARLLRFVAFIIAITAPAIYIALTSFHPELIPSDLLVTLARMRKEVPFPPVVEALVMEFVIEALREAGIRLPKSVAQTLGVVGGIVLGEAAIRANLVSPAMVLVTTVTAICTFSIPNYSMSLVVRLLRIFIIFLAALFGGYGIALGLLIILIHLAKQKSIGIPYLAPVAPLRLKDMKDFIYRAPLWSMKDRPVSIPSKEKTRVNIKKKGS
ncbi:MAG: hypothetical protein A2Y23_14025 [Clostridiales bacterium GWB2_37_7]|nr:MAG: hypothetical protein A2Y23_14025 [Clostridiales bacterium GWB2_37_7]